MNKDDLRQYRSLLKEIEELKEQRQTLLDKVFHAPMPDGMPKGKNRRRDFVGDTVSKVVDLSSLIEGKIDRLARLVMEIEAAIEALPSDERRLLRMKYIEGRSWPEISGILHYSLPHLFRKHKNSLKMILDDP